MNSSGIASSAGAGKVEILGSGMQSLLDNICFKHMIVPACRGLIMLLDVLAKHMMMVQTQVLAEWMAHDEPPMDLWPIDICRFHPFMNNKLFLRDRVMETLGLHYQVCTINNTC